MIYLILHVDVVSLIVDSVPSCGLLSLVSIFAQWKKLRGRLCTFIAKY